MRTFRDIIDLWATPGDLAREMGLPVKRVQNWSWRNSIPQEYHERLLQVAAESNIPLTAEDLIHISAASKPVKYIKRKAAA